MCLSKGKLLKNLDFRIFGKLSGKDSIIGMIAFSTRNHAIIKVVQATHHQGNIRYGV